MSRESFTVPPGAEPERPTPSGQTLGVSNAVLPETEHYSATVHAGPHRLVTDEPQVRGGSGSGPTPVGLVLAALASCTATTLRMYADRKYLDPGEINVHLRYHAGQTESTVDPEALIERDIVFTGPLEETNLDRLADIADKTPVTLIVRAGVPIHTTLRIGRES